LIPEHTQVTVQIPDRESSDCRAVSAVLARVGDKWSVLVVMQLGQGPRRFSELKRAIDGVSQRMLTLTLRGLERDGMVTRTVTPTIPPRVDYELTDLGRSLSTPVMALGLWAHSHMAEIDAAQADFDRRNGTADDRLSA
jgi:DNA-binding HxlR family transcriptional regulator